MYCDGKIRNVQAGACLASHTFVARSNQITRPEPHCGALVSINRGSPGGPPSAHGRVRHRLDKDTFHINCLPLSVSLGSKLVYTTTLGHKLFERQPPRQVKPCNAPCNI